MQVIDDAGAAVDECIASGGSWTETGGCIAGKAAKALAGALFTWEDLWWFASFVPWVMYLVARFMVGIASMILDLSIYFVVLNMGAFLAGEAGQGLRLAWGVIRDLANIAIIAGFITIAFTTILGVGQYSAQKFLAKLIIAALLVNFSFFITGAVIDASNFVASSVYTSNIMTSACLDQSENFTAFSGNNQFTRWVTTRMNSNGVTVPISSAAEVAGLCSISESFMAMMRVDTWDGIESLVQTSSSASSNGDNPYFKLFVLSLMAAIFLYTAAGVFFAAAFLLIGRFVTLIVLIVLSPLGIIASSVPYLEKFGPQWSGQLWSQALMAPAFMLIVALSLNILNGLSKLFFDADVKFSALPSSSLDTAIAVVPSIIMFAISIGFLTAALTAMRNMSQGKIEFELDLKAAYKFSDGLNKRAGNIPIIGPLLRGAQNRVEGEGKRDYMKEWYESQQAKNEKPKPNLIQRTFGLPPPKNKKAAQPTQGGTPGTGGAATGGTTSAAAGDRGINTFLAAFRKPRQDQKKSGAEAQPPTAKPKTGQEGAIRMGNEANNQLGGQGAASAGANNQLGGQGAGVGANTGLPVAGTPVSAAGAVAAANGNASDAQRAALERIANAIEKSKNTGATTQPSIGRLEEDMHKSATASMQLANIEAQELEQMRSDHSLNLMHRRKDIAERKDKSAEAKELQQSDAASRASEDKIGAKLEKALNDRRAKLNTPAGQTTSESIRLRGEIAQLESTRNTFIAARDARREEARTVVQTLRQEERAQAPAPQTPSPTPTPTPPRNTPPPPPPSSGGELRPSTNGLRPPPPLPPK